MCNFWSAIVSRTGKVYHLGEIISHEKTVKSFLLKDKDSHICRVEITPKKQIDYLKPLTERYWNFEIDEKEKPNWWEQKHKDKCWKVFNGWMKSNKGKQFKRRFRKIMKWAEMMKAKTENQHIYATKLTQKVKKLIEQYYEKDDWDSVCASVRASVRDSVRASVRDSVRASVRDSVWDSVWASVRDSVWDSVRDSVWDSVWASVRDSVWDSVRDSVWDSVWASVWASVRDSVGASVMYSLGIYLGNKDAIKMKLPADIFNAGIIHAKIGNEIWVWGKKGKLLAKWKCNKT